MKKQRFLFAIAMVALVAVTANAATWLGGVGSYTDGTQWDTGSLPAYNEDQIISSGTASTGTHWLSVGGGKTITINGGNVIAQGRKVAIGTANDGWGNLALSAGSLTFADNVSGQTYPSFEVGNYGHGFINQTGGDLTIEAVGPAGTGPWSRLNLGGGAGKYGVYYISGGTLTAGRLGNGWDGTGNFMVKGGGSTITLTGERGAGTQAFYQNGNSSLIFEIGNGAPGISTIDASAGTISLDGSLIVRFNEWTYVGATYDLITYGGFSGNDNFTSYTTLADSTLWGNGTVGLALHKSAKGNTTYMVEVISVPEPATMALLGLGGLLLRRRKSA